MTVPPAGNDLEARMRHLEDVEAIQRLKARYCHLADAADGTDEFLSLFIDGAVLAEPPIEVLEGKEEMRASFERSAAFHRFSRHYAVDPLIEIDGDEATGIWQGLLISVYDYGNGEQPLWASGEYREKYVRVDGDWKFARVDAVGRWMTSFDEGLVEVPTIPDFD